MATRDRHDAAFKRWFDHERMVEDLLRGFAPAELAAALEFSTLEPMPGEYAGGDRSGSGRADAVWRVRFRGRSEDWLYLLVLLEFQSSVDRHMAARVLSYTAQMYLKLIRGGRLPADGKLPPVLPVVIYNGERRWSAALEMSESVAAVGPSLAPYQPQQRHLLIDEHALRVEDLPVGNVVSAQIALEQGSVPRIARTLRELAELLPGPEHESLRRAFAELTVAMVSRSAAARSHPELASALEAAERTGGLSAMGSLLARRIDESIEAGVARGRTEGLEQGLEQGVARGLEQERAMLARQARRKFGAEAGARLAEVLAGVADAERLAGIGDLVIDCDDGAELLARAEQAARPA